MRKMCRSPITMPSLSTSHCEIVCRLLERAISDAIRGEGTQPQRVADGYGRGRPGVGWRRGPTRNFGDRHGFGIDRIGNPSAGTLNVFRLFRGSAAGLLVINYSNSD